MVGLTKTFDKKELVFLAALLDEEVILGVEDPFMGWLAEQVEEEWKRLSPRMIQNGLMSIGDDGGYEVSPDIADYIRLCCSPDIWVSVNVTRKKQGKSSSVLNLGITDKKAVKILQSKSLGMVDFCYGYYEGNESEEIVDALSINSSYTNRGIGFDIPERVFKAISDVSAEEGLAKLKDALNDSELEAESFVKALKAPTAKSIVNMGNMKGDSSRMTSFVLIEGEDCLWRAEYYDNDGCAMVSIRQSDAADCIEKIESYIEQLG